MTSFIIKKRVKLGQRNRTDRHRAEDHVMMEAETGGILLTASQQM